MILTDRKNNSKYFDEAFMQFVITTNQQKMSKNQNKNQNPRGKTIRARNDV